MPCYKPLTAYYGKDVGKSGKRGIVFNKHLSFSGIPFPVPCQQCVGCRLEYSFTWAVRCMHEKQMWTDNVFLTLTYDNKHLPEYGSLNKRHLSLFMKRLRKWYYAKTMQHIRFFACGEYGEESRRPHYHILLFNCDFSDKKFYKKTKRGDDLFTSEFVRKLWPMGFNVIGSVDYDSCAYVARYIVDKVTGDRAEAHYNWVSDVGECCSVIPEFTTKSNRSGGIGLSWFKKYGKQTFDIGDVVINGVRRKPPRYYQDKYEQVDPARVEELKVLRRQSALRKRADNTPDRLRVKEEVELRRVKMWKRET